MNKLIAEFYKNLAEKRETYLVTCLKEMIDRGILVIESRPANRKFETEFKDTKTVVHYSENIRLVCNDFKYIEELEAKLAEAEALLDKATDLLLDNPAAVDGEVEWREELNQWRAKNGGSDE